MNLLSALILVFGLNSGAFAKVDKCTRETRIPTTGTVTAGVDGDTMHLQTTAGTFSIRMLGMDTPETHFQGKSQGYWGEQAAAALGALAPAGTAVTIQVGTESCDSHGRVLAHIFRDGLHLNAEMVKRGLAVNYCVGTDFRYCEEFSRYTQNAIDKKIGMFSDPNVELPYDFRRRIENAPQRSYVGNIESKEVHSPGHQDQVPVADRVFFFTKDTVKDPYFLVD